MDDRITFVMGYRNLFNLITIFMAGVLITIASWSTEGTVIGYLMLVLGAKWLYDQVCKNIDDLEINDLLDKKEG
jgi:hypothetical protein